MKNAGPIVDPATHYRIEVRGRVDVEWLQRFDRSAEINVDETRQMEDILDLYAEPFQPAFPVICFDEVPYQMVSETQARLALGKRNGTPPEQRLTGVSRSRMPGIS